MRYYVTVEDETLEVELGAEATTVDGEEIELDLRRLHGTAVYSLLVDGASHSVVARRDEAGRWRLNIGGRWITADVVDERTRTIREMTGAAGAAAGPQPLRAPMPGMVVRIEVEEGEVVETGQGLAIVEAMKMENELRAEAPGRVSSIHVEAGQAVEKDQVMLEFEPPESEGGEGAAARETHDE